MQLLPSHVALSIIYSRRQATSTVNTYTIFMFITQVFFFSRGTHFCSFRREDQSDCMTAQSDFMTQCARDEAVRLVPASTRLMEGPVHIKPQTYFNFAQFETYLESSYLQTSRGIWSEILTKQNFIYCNLHFMKPESSTKTILNIFQIYF